MRHHHGRNCGCQSCQTIVHPTKHNCVNQCSESTVNHVHPSHTTIMNHHVVKNKHFYPHSTSVQNTTNSVDQYGGSFNVPAQNQVAGAFSPPGGMGNMGQGPNGNGQVMGATSPGMCQGSNGNGQVMGSMDQGNHWKKHGKWC